MDDALLRRQLVRMLSWEDAHVSFDGAIAKLDPSLHGERPDELPHSLWQLLEHLRLTQQDILEFCRDPDYRERQWPDDYWPASAKPPTPQAWDESVAGYRRDRAELVRLAEDESIDLAATIPHGSGQTYLREILLVADHTAYHVGQLILVRRLLGAWPTG